MMRIRLKSLLPARYSAATSGVTVIEYTLIAAGISLLVSAAVFGFGGELQALFERLGNSVDSAS